METAWIEEINACQASGISRSTLLRFAEAGYLKTKQSSNGSVLYSPQEISQVFGIEIPPSVSTVASERPISISTISPDENIVSATDADFSRAKSETESEKVEVKPLPDFIPGVGLSAKVTVENIKLEAPAQETATAAAHDASMQRQKMLSAIELLEKILQGKDSEIEDLRQQRQWLRERVQRLEEKSDRDQLLLLAETQTLRRMIEIQAPKKSFMERTMLALGFTPAEEEKKSDSQKTYER